MDKNISIIHRQSPNKHYNVYLEIACFEKITKIAKKFYPNEIGSSLVGNYSADGFKAYITDIAPISSDSISTKTSFNRGIDGLKNFFESLKSKFGYSKHYIGEWHSHPDGEPQPSTTDDKNQFAVSKDPKTNCPESILLIIGRKFTETDDIGIFIYSTKNGRVILS